MKALIITYYWPPSGGAGVQRWLKFTKYLPESGIEPIVLTVDPAMATYPQIDESLQKDVPASLRVVRTATREPFGTYKKMSGRKVVPSGGFSGGTSGTIRDVVTRFIRGNFFIPDARKGWIPFALDTATELIQKEKISTIITSSPPHSTQLIGLELKKRTGVHWIADLRDPWTDIYYYSKLLHTPWAKAMDRKMERLVLESADQVITVSEHIRKMFASKSKSIDPKKIHVIPNGYDESDFNGPIPSGSPKEFIISYTGTMAESYSPYGFFDALGRLMHEFPSEPLAFHFTGNLPGGMEAYLRTQPWKDKIRINAYAPHSEVVKQMRNSSVLYLAIPSAPGNEGILTGKLFEYLASRIPIIGTGPVHGDAAAILNASGAGKMLGSDNKDAIYEELKRLLFLWKEGSPAINTSEAVRQYSRKNQAGVIARMIK